MPAFSVRVPYLSSGAFTYGQVIDHWVFTYVSGPTALATKTVPATQYFIQYGNPANLPGAYTLSAQAFDASNTPVGSPIFNSFTVNDPVGSPPVSLAVRAYAVGAAGPNTFTLRFIYQSLGQFSTILDHTILTWSGPTSGSMTIAAGAQTATITGALNGLYTLSMQGQDASNANLGPAMTNQVFYYDDTQTTPSLLQPQANSPGVTTTFPGTLSGPGL